MTIIHAEPEGTYHGSGSFGIHALLDYEAKGPEFFRLRHVRKALEKERSRAFAFGTLAHLLILEGDDAYKSVAAVMPSVYPSKDGDKPWNGNATWCKDWLAQQDKAGKTPVSADDDACLNAMAWAVHEHPDARPLLQLGCPEVTVRQVEDGLPIQCRPDWMVGTRDPKGWKTRVELKTCDNLNGFMRDLFDYKYDRQCAFYDWMLEQEGVHAPCTIIAVEKSAPHRVGVYRFDDEVLERAHRLNAYLIENVAECWKERGKNSDVPWPRGDVPMTTVSLPHYLREEWQQARAAVASL